MAARVPSVNGPAPLENPLNEFDGGMEDKSRAYFAASATSAGAGTAKVTGTLAGSFCIREK